MSDGAIVIGTCLRAEHAKKKKIAKTKHASTLCRIQIHEQTYTWVFCEVFVVRNLNFLLVWIICSHIQFSSADTSSLTVWRFTALCRLHRLCASTRRLCTTLALCQNSKMVLQFVSTIFLTSIYR